MHDNPEGEVDYRQGQLQTANHRYTLAYSWPYRLIGPLFIVLAVSFPILLHTVDHAPITAGVWLASIAFLIAGAATTRHYLAEVVVTESEVRRNSLWRTTVIPWAQVVRVEVADGKFRLIGERTRLSIDTSMAGGELLARDLDRRFAADGSPRLPPD